MKMKVEIFAKIEFHRKVEFMEWGVAQLPQQRAACRGKSEVRHFWTSASCARAWLKVGETFIFHWILNSCEMMEYFLLRLSILTKCLIFSCHLPKWLQMFCLLCKIHLIVENYFFWMSSKHSHVLKISGFIAWSMVQYAYILGFYECLLCPHWGVQFLPF